MRWRSLYPRKPEAQLHCQWAPEQAKIIHAVIGDCGSQARFEALAAVIACKAWRTELQDSLDGVTLWGDAEGVLQAAEAKRLPNVHKMRTDLEQKTRPVITEIDLDASANFGDIVGLKWSSAYSPPELAALIYEYAQLPAEGRVSWEAVSYTHLTLPTKA